MSGTRLRLRLVHLDVFLQGMDEFLLEVLGRNRLFGDLTQRHDRVLVVVAVDGDLAAGGDHARAMAGEQNEIEAVFDLVDAIFDGHTGHKCISWRGIRQPNVAATGVRYRQQTSDVQGHSP